MIMWKEEKIYLKRIINYLNHYEVKKKRIFVILNGDIIKEV